MTARLIVLGFLAFCSGCSDGDGRDAPTEPMLDRGPDPFVFRTEPPEAYLRVDRMGVAAVATLVLPAGATRDQFNAGEPRDDGDYSDRIVPRLNLFHQELDDDLLVAGLSPCPVDQCIRQVVPGIVPDVIRLQLDSADGFPNGRTLADPVVDRLVAIALLDFRESSGCNSGPCTVDTFAQLPLNPATNEQPLLAEFPYFPSPHPPP